MKKNASNNHYDLRNANSRRIGFSAPIFLAGFLGLLAFAAPVFGQEYSLFNGQSLDGWVNGRGDAPGDGWQVLDGTIHRANRGGDIFFAFPFEDFEFSFRWKIATGGNSGIKYRVRRYGGQILGCEYQILDDGDNPHNKHAAGGLYAMYEPGPDKPRVVPDKWHTGKIVAQGNRIEHWLDGKLVVECRVASEDWFSRLASSKFAKHAGFGQNRFGYIMLQDHGAKVWFRDLTVRPVSGCQHLVSSIPKSQPFFNPE